MRPVRPKTIGELFEGVRSIHYLSYLRYLYFNIGRIAYLQANVLSVYVLLAPAIVAGVVTLGVMQQIIRAFGRVELHAVSAQGLAHNHRTIKRLQAFKRIRATYLSEAETGVTTNLVLRPNSLRVPHERIRVFEIPTRDSEWKN